MAVNLTAPEQLTPINGINIASCHAGIYEHRNDFCLIQFAETSQVAAVFTKNKFCAAPVSIAKRHLEQNKSTSLLINSGNANAGTGKQGQSDALQLCLTLSSKLGCQPEQILPFSTGVIGEYLPVEKMENSIDTLISSLSDSNWLSAAEAIMTTDTVAKGISKTFRIGDKKITITGIAKGSGMIRPDMATMLAFIGTDLQIDQSLLQTTLKEIVEQSFNRITVDGDTSTNDSCVIIATGCADNYLISSKNDDGYEAFYQCLLDVCRHLACAIIRDGEGATKFITIHVNHGSCEEDCLKVAYRVAESLLVKTAFTASDPNWGRLLSAIGNADTQQFDINKVNVYLGNVSIIRYGERAEEYQELAGKAVMMEAEIIVDIDLGVGQANTTIWTTDLSYDYIKINAEYRT